jgi:hypothetical protein
MARLRSGFTPEETQAILAEHYPWALEIKAMKIKVEQNYIGEFVAIDEDTYDCDCDQDGFFSVDPVGYGKTKADAIEDLMEQIND